MPKIKQNALDKLLLLAETEENEQEIRELVCFLLSKDRSEKTRRLCLRKLRALENEKCLRTKKCGYTYFDFSALVQNLCICSDILFGQNGHTLRFELEEMSLAACPQIIMDGFLNLISNAAKFSEDGSLTVRLTQAGKRALLCVRNRGDFDFEKTTFQRGIRAAANAARLHGGSLFYARCGGFVTAAFSLSLFLKPTAKMPVPLFPEMLTDEFSCVHIGLSDVENNAFFL